MKTRTTRIMECIAACSGALLFASAVQIAAAQEPANPPYLNPQLSPEQRATDLVHRMTLAEKATQMQNNSVAVPRLNIPAYQWWSEALHGVINQGVTEYPEPVGLAATFDAPGIHTMAGQIGIEGRIKHVQNQREGHTGIMGGLDFWSPNLLEKGRKATISMTYGTQNSKPHAELIWNKAQAGVSPEAIAAAKSADAVIAVVGITSQLEGEEMPVSEPGFLGGDRTSIDLPQPEEDLVEAMSATGKPLTVVLMNGSALAVNWIDQHANAILEAWYPGEEGGAAVAETLSGKNNPAGRLSVTFYRGVDQLPNFEDYGMANRTYRYFTGKPLYPFGYGLSYTKFSYSDLSIPTQAVAAGQPYSADVTVTNTGKLAGDEVVQLYLKFPAVKEAPRIALRGFERVHLEAGASQKVHFDLKPRDMGMVTEDGNPIIAHGEYTISIGGGQPDTGAPVATGKFHVDGQYALPE